MLLADTSSTVVEPSNPDPVSVNVPAVPATAWAGTTPVNWMGVPTVWRWKLLAAGTEFASTRMYQVPGAAEGTSNCGSAEPGPAEFSS